VAVLSQQQRIRCCKSLLEKLAAVDQAGQAPAAAAAGPQAGPLAAALQHLKAVTSLSGGSPSAAAMAAAAGVLEESVWSGTQAFGRWRLGVLLLQVVASFTG